MNLKDFDRKLQLPKHKNTARNCLFIFLLAGYLPKVWNQCAIDALFCSGHLLRSISRNVDFWFGCAVS